MSDDKKWTRRAAIGFLGGGSGLFFFNTDAATQIHADRSVNLSKEADDEKALLPLIDKSKDANISSPGGESTVYSISNSDIEWNIERVHISNIEKESEGVFKQSDDPIMASIDGKNIDVSCSGSGFSGKYRLTFELRAESENGQASVAADRTTNNPIPITCPIDYSSSSNYSDDVDGNGQAAVPGDAAKGVVSSPGNIGIDNDYAANIGQPKTGGGNISLLVGFVLPSVEPADCYTLTVRTSDGQGDLQTYLVGSGADSGGELVNTRRTVRGEDSDFDSNNQTEINDESDKISSSDTLYLVFEGRGKQTHDIEFINFKSCPS